MSPSSRPVSPIIIDIFDEIHKDLCNDILLETIDIADCGPTVLHLLRSSVQTVSQAVRLPDDERSQFSHGPHHVQLETLFGLANENINALPFNLVGRKWLRLYTDCSILLAIVDLLSTQDAVQSIMCAIRRLDMAIIVAGAAGDKRMGWIQALLQSAAPRSTQKHASNKTLDEPLRKRRKLAIDDKDGPTFAPNRVPTISPPSLSEYAAMSHKPFILKSYLDGHHHTCPPWAAMKRWNSADYLLKSVGKGRHVPVEIGTAYNESDWTQKIIPFEEFLSKAGYDVESRQSDSLEPVYLAQHALFNQFPALEGDMALPDYVWSNPDPPSQDSNYAPPTTESGVIVNVWVGSGSKKIVSPPHTDPYFNCYAQVLGRKRVWIAPPASTPFMAVHGNGGDDGANLADDYMSNTSTVPILKVASLAELKANFPEFYEHVWPTSMEAVLESGDLMVLPPGWWHSMRGECSGVAWSVSMWY